MAGQHQNEIVSPNRDTGSAITLREKITHLV
jgi:hypothetical protein